MPQPAVLEIILVRHATPIPPGTAGWEQRDDERPLTEAGLRDADELAVALDSHHFDAIYSSPYLRAMQTVTPTALRRGLAVQVIPDLRERRLSDGLSDDWPALLARSWQDPDFVASGGEAGRAAQLRGMAALDLLRTRHAAGGRLFVGSHGNLISLILQMFEPVIDHDFHRAMPMPAMYHLEHEGVDWRVLDGPGLARR